jgi:hypothetical protein
MLNLSAGDRKIVQRQLVELPPRTKVAQEKEMADMMGKLKQVSRVHLGICKRRRLTFHSLEMVS